MAPVSDQTELGVITGVPEDMGLSLEETNTADSWVGESHIPLDPSLLTSSDSHETTHEHMAMLKYSLLANPHDHWGETWSGAEPD